MHKPWGLALKFSARFTLSRAIKRNGGFWAGSVLLMAPGRAWAQAQPSQQDMQAVADGITAIAVIIQGVVALVMMLIPVVVLLIARRNMKGWQQPIKYVWFSYDGRLNRKAYWLKGVLLLWLVSFAAQLLSLLTTALVTMVLGLSEGLSTIVSLIILLPMIVFQIWAGTAVAIKRAHDLGHSGWWLLTFLIPLWNIWVAIQLAFFRGEPNDNEYGEDPLDSYGAYVDELRGGSGGGDTADEDGSEPAPRVHLHAPEPQPNAPKGFGGRKFIAQTPKAAHAAPASEAEPTQSYTPSADMDTIKRRLGSDILRPIGPKPKR